jgi:ubiquinone/menaquinone biosynthesis C-methylase UbiE
VTAAVAVRQDFEAILGLVAEGARVLDVGCGEGDLLERLVRTRQASRPASPAGCR